MPARQYDKDPMRDLDLTTLRLFVAVCETRNIARFQFVQRVLIHYLAPN